MKKISLTIAIGLLFIFANSCKEYHVDNNKDPEIEVPTDGLIAYYPFDYSIEDQGPYANHCFSNGGSMTFQEGIVEQAAFFNGTTDMLTLTNTLDIIKGVTVSFWVNNYGKYSSQQGSMIIGKYNASWQRSFYIQGSVEYTEGVGSVSTLIAAYFNDGSYDMGKYDYIGSHPKYQAHIDSHKSPELFTFHKPTIINENEWYHCVVNCMPQKLQLYINNTLVSEKIRPYTYYYNASNIPTNIGNIHNAGKVPGTNHFHGLLDEMRIYNRALTEKEIENIYKFR